MLFPSHLQPYIVDSIIPLGSTKPLFIVGWCSFGFVSVRFASVFSSLSGSVRLFDWVRTDTMLLNIHIQSFTCHCACGNAAGFLVLHFSPDTQSSIWYFWAPGPSAACCVRVWRSVRTSDRLSRGLKRGPWDRERPDPTQHSKWVLSVLCAGNCRTPALLCTHLLNWTWLGFRG